MTKEEQKDVFIYALLAEAQGAINRALQMAAGQDVHIDNEIWEAHRQCAAAVVKYAEKMVKHLKEKKDEQSGS